MKHSIKNKGHYFEHIKIKNKLYIEFFKIFYIHILRELSEHPK